MKTSARQLLMTIALAMLLPACSRAGAAVGSAAPEFQLTDTTGKVHKLSEYKGKVVVLEWVNPNCPFSRRHAEEGTMTRVAGAHPQVVWLGINSTANGHKDFLTPAQQASFNKEHQIGYPVLADPDGKVGRAYEAKTTPHMIVIDEEGKLVYDGAIDDDSYGKKDQRLNYVDAALRNHAAGKPVDPATTRPYGCSVKYAG